MPKDKKLSVKPISDLQLVWLLAKVNGGEYKEPPRTGINWPKATWLEKRREYLRQKCKKC